VYLIIIGLVIGLAAPAAAQQGYVHQALPTPPAYVPYSQVRPWVPPSLPPSSPGLLIPDPPPVPALPPACVYGCRP
jgi:hypothetical protein